MDGANVIFYIFLAVMVVLLLRWSIKVFIIKPNLAPRSDTTAVASRRARSSSEARRNDVYSISGNLGPNDPANNYQDYFWDVSPQASRSRTELAKFDKDLPSYEDVMQMEMRQQVVGSVAGGAGTPAIVPVTALTVALPVSQASVTASTV